MDFQMNYGRYWVDYLINLDAAQVRRKIEHRNRTPPPVNKKNPDRITLVRRAWTYTPPVEIGMLDLVPQEGRLKYIGGLQRADIYVHNCRVATLDLNSERWVVHPKAIWHLTGSHGARLIPGVRFGYVRATRWAHGFNAVHEFKSGRYYKWDHHSEFSVHKGVVDGLELGVQRVPTRVERKESLEAARLIAAAFLQLQPYLVGNEENAMWGYEAIREMNEKLVPRRRYIKQMLQHIAEQTTLSPRFVALFITAIGGWIWGIYRPKWELQTIHITSLRKLYLQELPS